MKIFSVVFLSLFSVTSCLKINLSSRKWLLTNENGSVKVKTRIPNDIYMTLYQNKLIPDPYFRDNDVNLRNFSYENWTFSTKFRFKSEILASAGVFLIAPGLDTIATIYLNKILIGKTENMFRTYIFDIKSIINKNLTKENDLKIVFNSPVKYSLKQSILHKQQYGYKVPLDCRPALAKEHGECHANFVRKVQSSFGWDWSPTFPTMGIWSDISIKAFNTCSIETFSVSPEFIFGQNSWLIHAEFVSSCTKKLNAKFTVKISELEFKFVWNSATVIGKNLIHINFTFPAKSETRIKFWWPNGYGTQKLYEVIGELSTEFESGYKSIQIGFRSVELIQEPVSSKIDGLTFYFKINNVPMFLKGSNWVPSESFPSKIDNDKISFYLHSIKRANMNIIRINGVGYYESDYFYQLCDQLGIMVWQDFMFASNLYPATESFLDNVRNEIQIQVDRLKYHPSIIVWSANNENEWGLRAGWFPLDAPFETYRGDYLKLYNDTVYQVIKALDHSRRPFVLSCPSNGLNSTRSGGIDSNPNSEIYGDIHFYISFLDAWNASIYPIARCVTEFGYQSLPSVETLQSALQLDDLRYFGHQMIHRQHVSGGEFVLLEQIILQFNTLSLRQSTEQQKRIFSYSPVHHYRFDDLIYLNHIHQAMAYKTATEHFRRWMSRVDEKTGRGQTMCALYWQLNDIWQGISFSSIDYGRKWKMLHYYAEKFFAPLLVSPYIEDNSLKINIISDLLIPVDDATVVLDVLWWPDGFKPVLSRNFTLKRIQPLKSEQIFEANIAEFVQFTKLRDEFLQIFFTVRILDQNSSTIAQNILFPDKLYAIPTEYFGHVSMHSVEKIDQKMFKIKLTADKIAPFVFLDVKGIWGYFSNNGFTMISNEISIDFYCWQNSTSIDEFENSLSITTLGDLYQNF